MEVAEENIIGFFKNIKYELKGEEQNIILNVYRDIKITEAMKCEMETMNLEQSLNKVS